MVAFLVLQKDRFRRAAEGVDVVSKRTILPIGIKARARGVFGRPGDVPSSPMV